MKEIKPDSNKHELDLIHRQNKSQETDSYLPKSIEIKISFINSIFADYLDVWFGLVPRQFFDDEKTVSKS